MRDLLESAKVAPTPGEAALILHDLIDAQGLLVQVYAELADWHRGLDDEPHAAMAPVRRNASDTSALRRATARLDAATQRAETVEMWLESALASSAEVQWAERPGDAPVDGLMRIARGAA